MFSGPALESKFRDLLARCVFPDGGRLDCAVSGGADSVALAVLACAKGFELTLHHVDHGLREGSSSEARLVADLARVLGAGFVSHSVDVGGGSNLEERARLARYEALPAGVATGHTMDDQVETMLINLMRGAGSAGLAGMRCVSAVRLRPLIGLRRSETVGVCEALGLSVFSDPMNSDVRFQRVRVRNELVSLMCDIAGRDIVPVLARQSTFFASESDFLDELGAAVDGSDAKAVAGLAEPVALRALRVFISRNWSRGHPPSSAAVERALDVARGLFPAADLEGGYRIHRTNQRLRIVAPE